MSWSVKVVADSVNDVGERLTTFELVYPLIVHNEFMTHREFSRNAASNRAIPVKKIIAAVRDHPYIPLRWRHNARGMVPGEDLSPEDQRAALHQWLVQRDNACTAAEILANEYDVAKETVNRLLGPWQFITVVCSSTNYANFFNQRWHGAATPEIQKLAGDMYSAQRSSRPIIRCWPYQRRPFSYNDVHWCKRLWHLPYITDPERCSDLLCADLVKVSSARCAAISYLRQNDARTIEEWLGVYGKLVYPPNGVMSEYSCGKDPRHMSPLEHPSRAYITAPVHYEGPQPAVLTAPQGNFSGWSQHRKDYADEYRATFDDADFHARASNR